MKQFLPLLFIAGLSAYCDEARAQSSNADTSADIFRRTTSTAGETASAEGITLTYIIGEAVGATLSNSEASKYVTAGFAQPDIELKEILDRSISAGFTVYPNPIKGSQVKVAFNNVPDGKYTLDLIDVLGRSVKSLVVDFKKDDFLYIDLDVSTLVKGVYFLRAGSSEFKGQVKLIKL